MFKIAFLLVTYNRKLKINSRLLRGLITTVLAQCIWSPAPCRR